MDRSKQIVLFICLIFLDQFSKIWFFKTALFSLNTGISFALLNYLPNFILTLLISLLLIALWFLLKTQHLWHWSLVLFFAGGVSNLIDRLLFGAVRDFLPFFQLNNNLADYFIIGGLGIFIINYCTVSRERSNQK